MERLLTNFLWEDNDAHEVANTTNHSKDYLKHYRVIWFVSTIRYTRVAGERLTKRRRWDKKNIGALWAKVGQGEIWGNRKTLIWMERGKFEDGEFYYVTKTFTSRNTDQDIILFHLNCNTIQNKILTNRNPSVVTLKSWRLLSPVSMMMRTTCRLVSNWLFPLMIFCSCYT